MNTWKAQLLHWAVALQNAAVQGGATALKAALALAVCSGAHLPVQALDLKQIGMIFGASALYHAMDFLSTHPLPDPLPDDNLGRVVKTLEQERTEGTEKRS